MNAKKTVTKVTKKKSKRGRISSDEIKKMTNEAIGKENS